MSGSLLVAGFAGLVTLALSVAHVLCEQRRRQELTALGRELGWRFTPSPDHGFADRFGQFECFGQGYSQSAYNTLSGEAPTDIGRLACLAGDYRHKIRSGSLGKGVFGVERFSYLLIRAPRAATADLRVRPERLGDALAAGLVSLGLGESDLRFESDDFNCRFHVTSRDRRFAYDVIHPRMMEYLLDGATPVFAIDEGWLCLVSEEGVWSADEFRSHLEWAAGLFSRWPSHLLPPVGPSTAAPEC